MADDIFADGFTTDPYWWDAAPRPKLEPAPLPREVDFAIVGSGFTGLSAAMTAARGGKDTLVIEAEDPGYGASSRNAGYVGRTLWHKFDPLAAKVGFQKAALMSNAAVAAHEYLVDLIEKEQISCGFTYCGRFIAAHTPGHFKKLYKDIEVFRKAGISIDAEMIPKAGMRREIGTDRYHGGMLLHGTGALHPGLYQLGLLERAKNSGAKIVANTRVQGVERDPAGGFTVTTSRGSLRARDVLVATNGYTGPESRWLRRRVIPIKAYQVATEPLPPEVLNAVLPGGRTLIDSKTNIYWVRLSPDNTRLIVGGRTGMDEGDLRNKARSLHKVLTEIYPDLHHVKLTHCWEGQMAFTFDKLPHIGVRDGVHYSMGYCGVGLPMGTWLGSRAAKKVLGEEEGVTPFDGQGFPTRPLYDGNPWFLPAMVSWYNLQDRWAAIRG